MIDILQTVYKRKRTITQPVYRITVLIFDSFVCLKKAGCYATIISGFYLQKEIYFFNDFFPLLSSLQLSHNDHVPFFMVTKKHSNNILMNHVFFIHQNAECFMVVL